MDKNLIKAYFDILDNAETNENDVQKFLEENTQLIPLPILENHNLHMNAVISKFKLGNEAVTDFAYLTKSSVLWKVVLVELESHHKKLFKESNNRKGYSAEFNNGMDQIRSWQIYIKENEAQVLHQLEKLRRPIHMATNMTYFEYVLIIGRSSELTEQGRKMLANTMNRENIKIMTYDSLVSRYTNYKGVDSEKILLSPWKEQGFKIKQLPKGRIDTSLFSYVTPEYLQVSKDQEKRLESEGYEMKEWRDGYALAYDEKKATDPLLGTKCRIENN